MVLLGFLLVTSYAAPLVGLERYEIHEEKILVNIEIQNRFSFDVGTLFLSLSCEDSSGQREEFFLSLLSDADRVPHSHEPFQGDRGQTYILEESFPSRGVSHLELEIDLAQDIEFVTCGRLTPWGFRRLED